MGVVSSKAGLLIGATILVAAAGPAWAQAIGNAATVRNNVVQVRGGSTSPISAGDSVVRNEVVRTGSESATKLVFRDNTNLAVGPTSTVTLDRFVFKGDDTASKLSVNLVKGAFRFTSGDSEKKAYEVKTPVATVGVRGTVFDVSVKPGSTFVRVLEGVVRACTASGSQCVSLSPGQSVTITANGIGPITRGGGATRFSFSRFCGSDGLCQTTEYASTPEGNIVPVVASNTPGFTPTDGAGVLCGR